MEVFMDIACFKDSAGHFQEKLKALRVHKKIVIGNQPMDEKAVTHLLSSDWLESYPAAVLIDLPKAAHLYCSLDGDEERKIETAFTMARVNYMGTDGVRGKVVTELSDKNGSGGNFIAALVKDNAFTPDLVETAAFAFAKMLLDQHIVKPGDTAVIGNDGRDLAYDFILNRHLCAGFTKAGLDVLDLGIVPTAVIPWQNLKRGHCAGACLTASHNPANQNGVKFFIDGKKLVPEGDLGDYVLSAYMYHYCFLEKLPPEGSGNISTYQAEADSVRWMTDILGPNMVTALKDVTLIFDSANGASDAVGRQVLENLGANYISVNEKCTGANINRNVGVAEIEGTEYYSGQEYDRFIPTVKKIFAAGRMSPAGSVYGIALDGDGDRGFLLYYSKKEDGVFVLDGDKCGYILAQHLLREKELNPDDHWFLSTIESDIMTAKAAGENLGLHTKVVSVGDKWIGNFQDGKVLIGLEISGHLIFPIAVFAPDGEMKTLLSGIGLLTGLYTLKAIQTMKLSEDRIITPFEPGFSKTYYVFFVDKTLHYRGSAIWLKDKALVENAVNEAVLDGKFPAGTGVRYEDKEDLSVLYANILAGDKLLGVLFMRNSGTEDKNAVYVKGERKHEDVLCEIGLAIQKMHAAEMKNVSRSEYGYEQAILKSLAKNGGKTTVDEVLHELSGVSEADLFSVVHGLKKEGRVRVIDREIVSNAEA